MGIWTREGSHPAQRLAGLDRRYQKKPVLMNLTLAHGYLIHLNRYNDKDLKFIISQINCNKFLYVFLWQDFTFVKLLYSFIETSLKPI